MFSILKKANNLEIYKQAWTELGQVQPRLELSEDFQPCVHILDLNLFGVGEYRAIFSFLLHYVHVRTGEIGTPVVLLDLKNWRKSTSACFGFYFSRGAGELDALRTLSHMCVVVSNPG